MIDEKLVLSQSPEFISDVDAVNAWALELYDKHFSEYFNDTKNLYKKIKTTRNQITDEELEELLTTLPLDLIEASEKLSEFKLTIDIMKLKIKERQAEIMELSQEKTITAKKEEAENGTIEEEIAMTVYKGVVTRVQYEMDFTRELIMTGKKIYDGRKSSQSIVPIGPVVPEDTQLPEYSITSGGASKHTYIG